MKNAPLLSTGFTLIELLITVAIISILAAISYPSFSHYLLKARRIKAEQGLYLLSQDLERYHTLNQSYQDAGLENLAGHFLLDQQYYQYSLSELSDSHYVIVATPIGNQTKDECGSLSLRETGERDVSGSESLANCWPT